MGTDSGPCLSEAARVAVLQRDGSLIVLVSQPVGECVRIVQGDAVVDLSVDEALALFGKLSGILPMMAAPELFRGRAEDGAEYWTCPHCRAALAEDGDLIEYESHQAEQFADVEGDDVYVNQGDTERATMAWMCGKCRRVVTVPGEMSVVWS